jgi:hypothetical protein
VSEVKIPTRLPAKRSDLSPLNQASERASLDGPINRHAPEGVHLTTDEERRGANCPDDSGCPLRVLGLWQERRLDTNRVFLYNDKPIQCIGTAFKAACHRAGITNLRVHDFRHTASTNLRRAGADTATAMKIVGHKSDRMHRRYNTIEPEDLHKAAANFICSGLTP